MAAVGTGDVRYARDFVSELDIPFRVVVDEEGAAARAASVRRATPWGLFSPRSWSGSRQAWQSGHHLAKPGKRVTQLGATLVLGPGSVERYRHIDVHTTDHAPIAEVLAALP